MNPWESEQLKEWTPTAKVLHDLQDQLAKEPSTAGTKLKLLCGADWLESFAVPNLWAEEDVSLLDAVGFGFEDH